VSSESKLLPQRYKLKNSIALLFTNYHWNYVVKQITWAGHAARTVDTRTA